MSFSNAFHIIKHLWPSVWFSAVLKEAEHIPATVAGVLVTGTSIVVLSLVATTQYVEDAAANEARLTSLQATIARNTAELACAKQDRTIAYMSRQLVHLEQLFGSVEDPTARSAMQSEIKDTRRNLRNAQTKYERECL